MPIDFMIETVEKRCRQMDRCELILAETRERLACGGDPSCIARGMRRLKRHLDRLFPDRKAAAAERELRAERDGLLAAIVRIGNWCAQDLAENAYVSEASGNYEKTLRGLCEICRPYMERAAKLEEYGGAEDGD